MCARLKTLAEQRVCFGLVSVGRLWVFLEGVALTSPLATSAKLMVKTVKRLLQVPAAQITFVPVAVLIRYSAVLIVITCLVRREMILFGVMRATLNYS